MVGDFDDCKISFVQNVRSLGGLEASNSLTYPVFSRVASQLKKGKLMLVLLFVINKSIVSYPILN